MNSTTISLKNDLSISVNVFQSYDDANSGLPNYIARLTFIGAISASGTIDINQDAEETAVYICYDEQNKPIKRIVFAAGSGQQLFTITDADVAVISSTYGFFAFIEANPNDPVSERFEALINGGNATPDAIDAFFKTTDDYQTCDYVSYILVLSALSASNDDDSLEDMPYSLKSLIGYMGVSCCSMAVTPVSPLNS